MSAIDRRRLWAIARKEALQLRRDTGSLLLAFLLPVLLLILFGYAITWDVDQIALAVVDQDRTAQSRELVARCQSSGYFRVAVEAERLRLGAFLMVVGKARLRAAAGSEARRHHREQPRDPEDGDQSNAAVRAGAHRADPRLSAPCRAP